MSDDDDTPSPEQRRSLQIEEGQEFPKHLVKSLFSVSPEVDPFGDSISVVQSLPESPNPTPSPAPEDGPSTLDTAPEEGD